MWPALIGAGGSIASGIMSLIAQGQQNAQQQQQLRLAREGFELQKAMAERQYQLATAGRTDARGSKTLYSPEKGWQTYLSPVAASLLNQSDALDRQANINALTRGEDDKGRNFRRRLTEGSTADPLLRAIQNGYGAPTRDAVGANSTLAGVTRSGEESNRAKSGYAGAALRTGGSIAPLSYNLAGANKGGTAGIRTALAEGRAGADPLFNSIYGQWMQNKLNPYNTLASRASNSEDVSYKPENISAPADAGLTGAATVGAAKGAGGSEALYRGIAPYIDIMGKQTQPSYDLFAAGVTKNLQELLRKWNRTGSSGSTGGTLPVSPDMLSGTGGIY